jgi:hypothetical protein
MNPGPFLTISITFQLLLLSFVILVLFKSENMKKILLLYAILYKTQKQLSFTPLVYFIVLVYFIIFTFCLFCFAVLILKPCA